MHRLKLRRERAHKDVTPDELWIQSSPTKFFAMDRELVAIASQHFGAEVIDTSDLNESGVTQQKWARLPFTRDDPQKGKMEKLGTGLSHCSFQSRGMG